MNILNNNSAKLPQTYFDQMTKAIVAAINTRAPMRVPLKRDIFDMINLYNKEKEIDDIITFKNSKIKLLTLSKALSS
jgi:hypothetical protein